MPGNRIKLTDEVQESICVMIRAGHYCNTAAMANGIGESTFHAWRSKGARARSGRYREFFLAVERAIAKDELTLVSEVSKGGPKGALEILKRRFPEHWGDGHRFEHSGPNWGPFRTETEHSGSSTSAVQIILAGSEAVWDPSVHGAVEEANEEDLPVPT